MKALSMLLVLTFISLLLKGQMLPISDRQLIETSDNIVMGKVLSSQAEWVNNGQQIYTFNSIKVEENLSGRYRKGEIITVVTPGGFDKEKDLGMHVSHQAHFEPGEEVVVFMAKAEGLIDGIDYRFLKNEKPMPNELMRVNGFFQGKRLIFNDEKTGQLMIHKPNESRSVPFASHQMTLKQSIQQIQQP
jgi:hypothetical protein